MNAKKIVAVLLISKQSLFTLQFSVSGLMILERNYLDVYPYDKWSDKVKGVAGWGIWCRLLNLQVFFFKLSSGRN